MNAQPSFLDQLLGGCRVCSHQNPHDSELRIAPLRCDNNVCMGDDYDGIEQIEVDDGSSSSANGRTREMHLGRGREAQLKTKVELKGAGVTMNKEPVCEALQNEADWLLWASGDLFRRNRWDLVSLGGNRYGLKGRVVSLCLLPPGDEVSPSFHLQKVVPEEVAYRAAQIIVIDGPLRQPILDYLLQTGVNEQWNSIGTENTLSNVHNIHKNVDFLETPQIHPEDRITAMTFATYHADVRHQATEKCTKGYAAGLFVEPPGSIYSGHQKGPQFGARKLLCGSPLDPAAGQLAAQA